MPTHGRADVAGVLDAVEREHPRGRVEGGRGLGEPGEGDEPLRRLDLGDLREFARAHLADRHGEREDGRHARVEPRLRRHEEFGDGRPRLDGRLDAPHPLDEEQAGGVALAAAVQSGEVGEAHGGSGRSGGS